MIGTERRGLVDDGTELARDAFALRRGHERRFLRAEGAREDVFKPFFRLDEARNLDKSGTGLGLAIARDIARSHGGNVTLGDSPQGGLRATIRIPA